MKALHEKIRKEGKVLSHTILKVDSFLNHQIDAKFMLKVGEEFAKRFEDEKITKVITIETSGIAPAMGTAASLGVPLVFAKKSKSSNMDQDVYSTQVKSFTRGTVYDIKIAKEFIDPEDRILVIDDFLAFGHALLGLKKIINESGAEFIGAGIVIEKGFQGGGESVRKAGIRVESLAIIEAMKEDCIIFCEK
ncbi:xanthine phosphoribosyltransferase [Marinisporobacter balticus]|uniref:Xanthine phosphoribosyltransferase n=1 Tax=Marinisporobacter balticus TaxID=2018667 RepID=A0A4R2L5E4_9FIRM|nr:xanthine phosphoribosyltransferase [Marinisporobacter balticus]TCO74375.1 xanthine phosphoribosyltransferase [Marinisporobacter balticus]